MQFGFNPLLHPFFTKENAKMKRIYLKYLTKACESGLISILCCETFIVEMKIFEGFVELLLFVVTEEKPFIRRCQEIPVKYKGKKMRTFLLSEKSDQKFLRL